MNSRLASIALIALAIALPAAAQQPNLTWYDVPVVSGSAGNFTCVTQPAPSVGAVITCNPNKMAAIASPDAQAFLLAHEHGHVLQFAVGLQFSTNPEADADCYAAMTMATTNPQGLAAAIWWFEHVLGNGGGDTWHGTGFQVAAFARQCAARVGVQIP